MSFDPRHVVGCAVCAAVLHAGFEARAQPGAPTPGQVSPGSVAAPVSDVAATEQRAPARPDQPSAPVTPPATTTPVPSPARATVPISAPAPRSAATTVQARTPVPPKSEQSPVPTPEQPPPERARFVADPVADGAVLSLALGVGLLSEVIIGTGEITPQQPQAGRNLLSIDRGVIEARPIPAWGTISNLGFGVAIGYAVVDPLFTGYRSGIEAGIVDAVIYAETISVTWAVTNLAKISFRRPRPSAYQEQARLNPGGGTGTPVELSDTNSALSFFSGHASITASVAAAATYLAFSRSDSPVRPWLTLVTGAAVTTLTSVGRVKSGKHFPTDVIAGAMVGAGIGVLVPHLHREASAKQRPVWIGFTRRPGGATIDLYGPL